MGIQVHHVQYCTVLYQSVRQGLIRNILCTHTMSSVFECGKASLCAWPLARMEEPKNTCHRFDVDLLQGSDPSLCRDLRCKIDVGRSSLSVNPATIRLVPQYTLVAGLTRSHVGRCASEAQHPIQLTRFTHHKPPTKQAFKMTKRNCSILKVQKCRRKHL